MKNNKGITLIALVITIIVLLILAGVTLAMITGENSIFTKAGKAAVSTRASQGKELASVIAAEVISDFYEERYVGKFNTSNYTGSSMKVGDYLKSEFGSHSAEFQGLISYAEDTITILNTDPSITGTFGDDGTITWSDAATD